MGGPVLTTSGKNGNEGTVNEGDGDDRHNRENFRMKFYDGRPNLLVFLQVVLDE